MQDQGSVCTNAHYELTQATVFKIKAFTCCCAFKNESVSFQIDLFLSIKKKKKDGTHYFQL